MLGPGNLPLQVKVLLLFVGCFCPWPNILNTRVCTDGMYVWTINRVQAEEGGAVAGWVSVGFRLERSQPRRILCKVVSNFGFICSARDID